MIDRVQSIGATEYLGDVGAPQSDDGQSRQFGFIPMSEKEKQTLEHNIDKNEKMVAQYQNSIKNMQYPKIPEQPKPDKQKVITIEYGDTASELAEKYHCTMAELKKANPEINLEGLVAGKKLNMPYVSDEKWKPYGDAVKEKTRLDNKKSELENKIRNLQSEIARDKKILQAESIIGEIQSCSRSKTFAERYNISINKKTGDLIIKFKKDCKLSSVKSDFHLKDGVLIEANGADKIKSFKAPFMQRIGFGNVYYDEYEAPDGETLIIPTDKCKPKTAWYK